MIDDNAEIKPEVKKAKADVVKKTEHAKTDTKKAGASHKK
jgi:hypothetical protein